MFREITKISSKNFAKSRKFRPNFDFVFRENFAKLEENFAKHEIKISRNFREIAKTKIFVATLLWVQKYYLREFQKKKKFSNLLVAVFDSQCVVFVVFVLAVVFVNIARSCSGSLSVFVDCKVSIIQLAVLGFELCTSMLLLGPSPVSCSVL